MIILGPGDIFGDIEYNKNMSKFNYELVCVLNNSELYTCPIEVKLIYSEIQNFIGC
jgi:hypothetical protein